MDDRATGLAERPAALDLQVTALSRTVAELADRIAALEKRVSSPYGLAPATSQMAQVAEPFEEEDLLSGLPTAAAAESGLALGLALTGRTLLALGGAYLLRALTAAGLLPQWGGVLLAFVYALVWLGLAYRTGIVATPAGRASAVFHGTTAALIAFPLLWEATTHFHYIGPVLSALAVAGFAGLALAVAWRRELGALAWVAGLGGALTAFALISGTAAWPPFVAVLLVLGLAGLAVAFTRAWYGLGWTLGAIAHLAILLMVLASRVVSGSPPPVLPAVVLGLAVALTYLGVFAWRAVVGDHEVTFLEATLAPASFLCGYGGAAILASRGAMAYTVGAIGLAVGLTLYGLGFFVLGRTERRKLLLISTLALGFVLAGSALLLEGAPPALGTAWAALAVVAAWRAVVLARVTLSLHGAVYALAAAVASGLATSAAYAFVAAPQVPWPTLSLVALFALAAAAVCAALPVPLPASFWGAYTGFTRVLRLAVFVFGAGGALLYLVAPWIAGRPGLGADPGLLATVRTAVLVAAAFLLGAVARWPRWREAAWLVYPALLVTGIKLLAEDFPHGRPATLFVSLALCGLGLLLAPRLARRAKLEGEAAAV